MRWLVALGALAGCLAVQVLLGRLVPDLQHFADFLALPMAWYGLRGAQRSAMLAGAAGGLLQDAWFEPGLVGASGFSKTLLGWALGVLGARFDLNAFWARSIAGAALPVLEILVESGLRRLFDQAVVPWAAGDLALRAVVGGLLVPLVFAILDRGRAGRPGAPARRRRP